MSDVFIGYVKEDSEIAVGVARGLEDAGYRVWYYERDARAPVPTFLEQARRAINQCQVAIVVISEAAFSSPELDVEINYARTVGRRFVPVLRGVTYERLKKQKPDWAMSFGASVALLVPPEGILPVVPLITSGFKESGILPGVSVSSPFPGSSSGAQDGRVTQQGPHPSWRPVALVVGVLVVMAAAIAWLGMGAHRESPPTTPALASEPLPPPQPRAAAGGGQWKAQTGGNSRGFQRAEVRTGPESFQGRGYLALTADLAAGTDNRRAGEVLVDLRANPPHRGAAALGAPVDLDGKLIYAMVNCPEGSGGSSQAPNGLQLFAKSIRSAGGKDLWDSFYGDWHNIWVDGPDVEADARLGDVREGNWSLIVARVGKTQPPYGYADPGFDPTRVVAVGLKISLNDSGNGRVRGAVLVDDFGWGTVLADPVGAAPIAVHSPAELTGFLAAYCQAECSFDFEPAPTGEGAAGSSAARSGSS